MREIRLISDMPLVINSEISLLDDNFRHASKVLRLNVGNQVTLICGDGFNYAATVNQIEKKSMQLFIHQKTANPTQPSAPLILAIALLKGEPMDRVLQKAVELGVSDIYPMMTERSERKISAERWLKKVIHWEGILKASALQCGRSEWPTLHNPINWEEAIILKADLRWILSPHHRENQMRNRDGKIPSLALTIGPEGGLTEQEVALALDKGWQSQSLGPRILRADTAVIAALVKANIIRGEMSV